LIGTVLCVSASDAATADATPGPLLRAALATLEAEELTLIPPRSEKSRTDWAPVIRLRPGGDIILTVRGQPAATRRLLFADSEELTLLDVSGPTLPKDVRKVLLDFAEDRPLTLLAAQTGELQLSHGLRVTPAGIFLADNRVAELAEVIRSVPRALVADIRVRRKHVGTHVRRGLRGVRGLVRRR
jgi:hypothetical protein